MDLILHNCPFLLLLAVLITLGPQSAAKLTGISIFLCIPVFYAADQQSKRNNESECSNFSSVFPWGAQCSWVSHVAN